MKRIRVPREKLHRLEMLIKGKFFRVSATLAGGLLGFGGGVAVSFADYFMGSSSSGAVAAAAVGISAAGIAGGYFAGNALDKRWYVIEIEP